MGFFSFVRSSCEDRENGGTFYKYDSDHHIRGPQALRLKQ